MDLCPCPIGGRGGGSSTKRSIELSPFRTAGSGSDSDKDGETEMSQTLADKAKGWFSMAVAPITKMKEDHDKANKRAGRVETLKGGATMKLLPDGRGEPTSVRVALSSDGAMVTWNGVGKSGVMALSAVREVKPVLASGFFRAGDPIPGQWMLVADDQSVRFEASDEEKAFWMSTIEELAQEQVQAKTGRKVAATARRKMGIEERRREAERRKAEVLKTCASGGMKHTAAAMSACPTNPRPQPIISPG